MLLIVAVVLPELSCTNYPDVTDCAASINSPQDRNSITVARLDGMEEDLGLVGNQYLTAVSILFVGYILGQLPASRCSI